jgi:hypothetical protein
MALRLHRVTDDTRQRLANARRARDLTASPARASIGAIEIELRALVAREAEFRTADDRQAAAG